MRYLAILILTILLGAGLSGAYVAESPNYRIQSDSINFGGGLSTSDSYQLQTTAGEVAMGRSSTSPYSVNAGFQEMQEVYVAMSGPGTVSLGALDTGTAAAADGTGTWTITTDNPAGYSLAIKAAANPAMQSADDSLDNYTATGGADYEWTVDPGASEFGFTPSGADISTAFLDNGSTCGTGALDTAERCWAPILTTNTTIAESTTRTSPAGTDTTITFKAEVGATRAATQTEGAYSASLTLTTMPR